MQKNQRVLTGITTSGIPHLGNLIGAILPAIQASNSDKNKSFLFLADYHSLIKNTDPALTHSSSFEIIGDLIGIAYLDDVRHEL